MEQNQPKKDAESQLKRQATASEAKPVAKADEAKVAPAGNTLTKTVAKLEGKTAKADEDTVNY